MASSSPEASMNHSHDVNVLASIKFVLGGGLVTLPSSIKYPPHPACWMMISIANDDINDFIYYLITNLYRQYKAFSYHLRKLAMTKKNLPSLNRN